MGGIGQQPGRRARDRLRFQRKQRLLVVRIGMPGATGHTEQYEKRKEAHVRR
jgi:hypothetical protein